MSSKEFKEYLKGHVKVENGFSRVVQEMVESGRLDLSHNYYLDRPDYALSAIERLDECLKYCVANLDGYGFVADLFSDPSRYSRVAKGTVEKNSFYGLQKGHTLSIESTKDTPCVIHYLLSGKIDLDKALEKNLGVVSLNAITDGGERDDLVIYTTRVGNKVLCVERYHPGVVSEEITTTVYDVDEIIRKKGKCLIVPNPTIELPSFLTGITAVESIDVTSFGDGNYTIEYQNREESCEPMTNDDDSTIYSFYYKLMVQLGYFNDDTVKKGENTRH